MNCSIDETLKERGDKYGPFDGHASVSMSIKRVIESGLAMNPNFRNLDQVSQDVLTEGLGMIAHKIGRAVNGDPTYDDNFTDIEGYAKLIKTHFNNRNNV